MNSIHPVSKYFPGLSQKQTEQFALLGDLYNHWNDKINVISRKDIEHLYEKHILHSLAIAKFISFKGKTEILDVGTGGGFPGIPLAILFPEVNFFLSDSIGKKIKVVNTISSEIKLGNVTAVQSRAEAIDKNFDFVVSRATSSMSDLYNWTRHKISKKSFNDITNGIICLKGGNLEEELKRFNIHIIIKPLSDFFEEHFFETKQLVYLPLHEKAIF